MYVVPQSEANGDGAGEGGGAGGKDMMSSPILKWDPLAPRSASNVPRSTKYVSLVFVQRWYLLAIAPGIVFT